MELELFGAKEFQSTLCPNGHHTNGDRTNGDRTNGAPYYSPARNAALRRHYLAGADCKDFFAALSFHIPPVTLAI